jgi:hypothetical protein
MRSSRTRSTSRYGPIPCGCPAGAAKPTRSAYAREHHELRQLGEQRRERPLGDAEGGSSVGRLDAIDHLELAGSSSISIVKRTLAASNGSPSWNVAPERRRKTHDRSSRRSHDSASSGTSRPSVAYVTSGFVDVAVEARLDQAGLKDGMKPGRVRALCHDQLT